MSAMSRLRSFSSALLSVVLLLPTAMALPFAGPLAGATPEPGSGQTPSPPAPAAGPRVNWGSCNPFLNDTTNVPTAKCTTVSVPVDYRKPGGSAAKLAVIRVPATGPRIGSLLINPGGPGGSAVEMVRPL